MSTFNKNYDIDGKTVLLSTRYFAVQFNAANGNNTDKNMIKNNLNPQKIPNFSPVWAVFVVNLKCHFKEKNDREISENVHNESSDLRQRTVHSCM